MSNISISFDNLTVSEANKMAADLQEFLSRKVEQTAIITKTDDATMDFGATVVVLLGTTSAVAVARGIANWIKKRSEVSITIKTDKGEVIAQNLTSADVLPVLETSFQALAK
ncbi:MAG: hypothetical protein QM762_14690 [Chryseolinea sp.]